MTSCEDVRMRALLGIPLDDAAVAHVHACPTCAAQTALRQAPAARRAQPSPAPAPGLTARVMLAAAPLLARQARRAVWAPLLRAIAAALLPLPLIVLVDAYLLRGLYTVLTTIFPETVSLYLVLNYAGLLALVATLTYGTVPLLAAHQARLRHEVAHG